ncbi:hypothetical protein QFC24_000540 [Naganishia onofrii]|uniref:Uncharacterized protein n=1 Tax=Naganishia onofrii TaxID=1851511 RepID=A0ACC2XXR3_9TREE|nr:hypothetical protein QFC24_000540 [Naganishia onofrii]
MPGIKSPSTATPSLPFDAEPFDSQSQFDSDNNEVDQEDVPSQPGGSKQTKDLGSISRIRKPYDPKGDKPPPPTTLKGSFQKKNKPKGASSKEEIFEIESPPERPLTLEDALTASQKKGKGSKAQGPKAQGALQKFSSNAQNEVMCLLFGGIPLRDGLQAFSQAKEQLYKEVQHLRSLDWIRTIPLSSGINGAMIEATIRESFQHIELPASFDFVKMIPGGRHLNSHNTRASPTSSTSRT